MSIGARSQSARTYLERHMDKFMDCKHRRWGLEGLGSGCHAEEVALD